MIGATIRKDVQLLLHDRGRLLMLFAMPLVFIVVFGSMFSGGGGGGGKPEPIAIWHAAGDARGAAIERALGFAPGFAAEPMPSADAVRRAVAKDTVHAGLIVPPSGPVELSIDLGAPAQVVGPLRGALTGVVMAATMPRPKALAPPVIAKSPPGIAPPASDVSGFQLTVPANGVLFGFFLAMTVAMSFSSERHSGIWRRMLASPVPRWKAIGGKLVPYFLIGLVQLGTLFVVGALAFGMKVAGSVPALCVVTVVVVACAVCLGMLVASWGWNEKQIGSIVPVILLVLGLLGGCMYPRMLMPPFMKSLGLATPHGWALDAYYALLVRSGTTLADVAPQIGALLGFAALFAVIGVRRFEFER